MPGEFFTPGGASLLVQGVRNATNDEIKANPPDRLVADAKRLFGCSEFQARCHIRDLWDGWALGFDLEALEDVKWRQSRGYGDCPDCGCWMLEGWCPSCEAGCWTYA